MNKNKIFKKNKKITDNNKNNVIIQLIYCKFGE